MLVLLTVSVSMINFVSPTSQNSQEARENDHHNMSKPCQLFHSVSMRFFFKFELTLIAATGGCTLARQFLAYVEVCNTLTIRSSSQFVVTETYFYTLRTLRLKQQTAQFNFTHAIPVLTLANVMHYVVCCVATLQLVPLLNLQLANALAQCSQTIRRLFSP